MPTDQIFSAAQTLCFGGIALALVIGDFCLFDGKVFIGRTCRFLSKKA